MRRTLAIVIVSVLLTATAFAAGQRYFERVVNLETGEVLAEHVYYAEGGLVPNMASPNWKPLSDDVAVWVTKTDRYGLRGRLYVKLDGAWHPVATDGIADVRPFLPAR